MEILGEICIAGSLDPGGFGVQSLYPDVYFGAVDGDSLIIHHQGFHGGGLVGIIHPFQAFQAHKPVPSKIRGRGDGCHKFTPVILHRSFHGEISVCHIRRVQLDGILQDSLVVEGVCFFQKGFHVTGAKSSVVFFIVLIFKWLVK